MAALNLTGQLAKGLCGVSERQASQLRTERMRNGQDCSFADVNRACHRWLMQRDEEYRATHEAARQQLDRRNARAAGIAESDLPHQLH